MVVEIMKKAGTENLQTMCIDVHASNKIFVKNKKISDIGWSFGKRHLSPMIIPNQEKEKSKIRTQTM